MTECDRIHADAPGLAALLPEDPERIAAESHASGCAGCARALAEGARLRSLLSEAAPAPLSAAALGRAYQEIRGELRREARRRLVGSIAAVCASVLVLVGFARARSPSAADWVLAAVLWATAVVLAAAASRRPRLVIAGSVLAAAVGTASGGSGSLVPSVGLECLVTELASAGVVVGAAWLAVRGGSTSPARAAIAAAAAAGALAGDAALQVTCAAHGSAPHLLAFHVGGVLLAAAGAALLWRRRLEPQVA